MLAALTLLAFLAFALTDWVAVNDERRALEYVAKPAALAALLLYALTGGHSSWLIAALALSLLGDVYLMLPTDLFLAGMAAFFLAHVAYVGAFDASLRWRIVWWMVALAASAPVSVRIVRAIQDPGLRFAVVGYMAIIGLMVGSAFASGRFTAVVGALLFLASDSIIAWNRFVQPLTWAQPTIMITYHLGQLGLVLALRAG